jgi:hypothetical protein
VSIAYSRNRLPLWISPNGRPARAAQAGKVLGIFPRSRLWITLTSNDAAHSPIVLRVENDAQLKRVVGALEEQTGVKARRVIEPNNSK